MSIPKAETLLRNKIKGKAKQEYDNYRQFVQTNSSEIVRGIYLPTEQINALKMEIQDLKALLEEKEVMNGKEINLLKEDRRKREDSLIILNEENSKQLNTLTKKCQESEKLNTEITKGCFIKIT